MNRKSQPEKAKLHPPISPRTNTSAPLSTEMGPETYQEILKREAERARARSGKTRIVLPDFDLSLGAR